MGMFIDAEGAAAMAGISIYQFREAAPKAGLEATEFGRRGRTGKFFYVRSQVEEKLSAIIAATGHAGTVRNNKAPRMKTTPVRRPRKK